MKVTRAEFEQIVYQKFETLPKDFQENLDNVEIFVENRPDSPHLLGLYHGVPFPHRKNPGYSLVMPDKIILFKETIERDCRTREELEDRIEQVLFHEIGHYFGMGEKELRKLKL